MGRVLVIDRRIGAALGVLSILFLSLLPLWRAAVCSGADGLSAFYPQIICKADASTGHSRLTASPDAPTPKHTECPICLGLVTLQLAVVAAALLGLALARSSQPIVFPTDLLMDGRLFGLLPSSRAPPFVA